MVPRMDSNDRNVGGAMAGTESVVGPILDGPAAPGAVAEPVPDGPAEPEAEVVPIGPA